MPHTTHRKTELFSLLTLYLFLTLIISPCPVSGQNNGEWFAQATAGSNPEARHESAFVRSGELFYLMGGRGQRTIQVYNPTTKQWSNTNTTLNNIHHFQARSYQGKIYLLGALTGGFPNEDPLNNVLIYDPQLDKLTKGATIPVSRRRGSGGVVLYNEAFYLIAGNRNGHSAYLDDGTTVANVGWTDKYDPSTDVWTVLPDAPHARDHFFAEVIGDKIYVAGGRRSKSGTPEGTFSDTETGVDVFDLTTERWLQGSDLPADLPTARAGAPTAVVNNELLVIGGEIDDNPPSNLALPHTEILNPTTGTWRRAADLQLGRHGTQALVYNNDVYVAGGSKTRGGTEISAAETYMEVFSYDGAPGTDYTNWTTIGNSKAAKSEAQMMNYGGEFYVFNGFLKDIKIANSVDKYNPVTNVWTSLQPMPPLNGALATVTHHGIALVGDEIWIVGGRIGDHPGAVTDAVWIYHITSDTWSEGPKLPLRRGGGGLGRLGRSLHYVGGFDENASCDVNIHLKYDLDNPGAGWQDLTSIAPMPMARNHFSTVVLGGKLYTIGGQNGHDGCGGGADNKLVHVFDPITGLWTRLADLPAIQSHAEPSTFAYNGKILLVGGASSGGKGVWEYDPATNKWTVLSDMTLPLALLAPSARVYDGKLFVLNGGAPGTGSPVNDTRVKNFKPILDEKLVFNPASLAINMKSKETKTIRVILSNLNGENGVAFHIPTANIPSWLSLDQTSGYARESFTEIRLTVNTDGLEAGNYSYNLQAQASGYSPASLGINLSVGGDGSDPPPPPPPADKADLWLEAECATVGDNWNIVASSTASQQSYVTIKTGLNAYQSSPGDDAANRISFRVNIPVADSYQLFARIDAPSGNDDSFWVRVNGGSWVKWWNGLQTAAGFAWRGVSGSPFNLSSGEAIIDFAYREDGTHLDKILLTSKGTDPTDVGGPSTNCGAPPPPPPPSNTAIRINAGGPAISHDGKTFTADTYFTGGKVYTNTSAAVPPLYQTERSSLSPFWYTYNIPVPNGTYTVRLHFAEIYFGATGGGPGGEGKRIFDVTLEDQLILDNFDITAESGPETILVKEYTVNVADGSLDLLFDASSGAGGTDQPKLSALEVIGTSSGPGPGEITELWAEAECAQGGSQWQLKTATTASNNLYAVFPGSNNFPAPTGRTASELLDFSVDLTKSGTYQLYFRVNTPSPGATGKNSFWVSVDNGPWIKFWRDDTNQELLTKGFEWRRVADDGKAISLQLASGRHTITVAPRETGTQLDKIYLGMNVPTDRGATATNCGNQLQSAARPATFNRQQDHFHDHSLILFPNPVSDWLTYKLSDPEGIREVQILDLYGRILIRQSMPEGSTASQQNVIDVTSLPRGTYYLRAVAPTETIPARPFVKK